MRNKVLVIDDSATNIMLIVDILSSQGFDVVSEDKSKNAILTINNVKPNLILLDIMMPGISGFDILKQIKESNDIKNIPVIMVTAKAESENVSKALQLGAIDFIKKPIDMIDLVSRVNNALLMYSKDVSINKYKLDKEYIKKNFKNEFYTPIFDILNELKLFLNEMSINLTDKSVEEKIKNKSFKIDTAIHLLNLGDEYFLSNSYEGYSLKQSKDIYLHNLIVNSDKSLRKLLQEVDKVIISNIPEDFTVFADETLFSILFRRIIELYIYSNFNNKEIHFSINDNNEYIYIGNKPGNYSEISFEDIDINYSPKYSEIIKICRLHDFNFQKCSCSYMLFRIKL